MFYPSIWHATRVIDETVVSKNHECDFLVHCNSGQMRGHPYKCGQFSHCFCSVGLREIKRTNNEQASGNFIHTTPLLGVSVHAHLALT